jgi:HEAT repeat protein
MEAFEAAKAIWEDSDPDLEPFLILTLKKGRRPFNRAAAAYAMQMLKTRRTIRALEETTINKSEHPRVRGEAAEARAHGHRRKSHEVLLKSLRDPSKDVRFWCAFALGEMADKRTIPTLKRFDRDRQTEG